MTPPTRLEPAARRERRPPPAGHRASRSRFLAWTIPVLFILACVGLFVGVLWFLKPEPVVPESRNRAPSSVGESSKTGLWPINSRRDLPHEPGGHRTGDGAGASQSPSPGPPAAPDAATRATAVVQDFLAAANLEQRMPLMISRRSPEQLAKSSLAGKLPGHLVPELERQISIPRELLTEFYYTVSFPGASNPNPQVLAVLVRQRGDKEPPKVLADPFIDLFDGGLRQFGAEPLDGSRTFHVLAEPIPICNDLNVPEADQRITLRLRPHENGKELASAYTRKVSEVGEMLNQPRSTLRWGQAHPCVVTVQWNRETPEQPFLELVRLDAITWNQ